MSESKKKSRKSKLVPKNQSDSFVELNELEQQITQEEEEINELLNITNNSNSGHFKFDIKVEIEQIDDDEDTNFYTNHYSDDEEPRLMIDEPESYKIQTTETEEYHDDDNPVVLCDLCGLHIKKYREIKNHINSLHKNITDIQIMEEVNFKKKVIFLYSNEFNDNAKKSLLNCTDCRQVFKVRQLWHQHFIKQYHACNICGKYYDRCKQLNEHAAVCKGIKNVNLMGDLRFYRCSICTRLFSKEPDLDEHLADVHIPSSVYAMPTQLKKCCDCKLKYAGSYVAHFCPKRKDNYFCKYCTGGFRNKMFLKAHHLGHKPLNGVKCVKCNVEFDMSCQLENHICGTPKYRCKICDTIFSKEDLVESHLINDHKKGNYIVARAYYEKFLGKEILNETINGKSKTTTDDESNAKISPDEELQSSVKYIENLLTDVSDDNIQNYPVAEIINDETSQSDEMDLDLEIIEEDSVSIIIDDEMDDITTQSLSKVDYNKTPTLTTEIVNEIIVKEEPIDTYEIDSIEIDDSFSDGVVNDELKSDEFEDDIILLNSQESLEVKIEEYNCVIDIDNSKENVEKKKKRIYQCKYCSFKSINKTIATHECKFTEKSEKSKKQKKLYRCIYCEYKGVHKQYQIHNSKCNKRAAKIMPYTNRRTDLNCIKCNNPFNFSSETIIYSPCFHCHIYNCRYCYFQTESDEDYRTHLRQHLMENYIKVTSFDKSTFIRSYSFKCKICKEIFEINELNDHWLIHVNNANVDDKKPLLGIIKQEQNSTKGEIEKDKLQDVIKSLLYNKLIKPCLICDKSFSRKNDHKRHLIEHLLSDAYSKIPGTVRLSCQICQFATVIEADYKQHMREHASLTTYKCPLCEKCFSDSSNFSKHKKVHNITVMVCDLCDRKFTSKNQLINHFEKHNNSKPISCVLCDKEFAFVSSFWKHMKMVHIKTILKYKCPICKVKFSSLKDKWNHQWLIHNQRKVKADCQLCGKNYRRMYDLKRHIKEHMENMEFASDI